MNFEICWIILWNDYIYINRIEINCKIKKFKYTKILKNKLYYINIHYIKIRLIGYILGGKDIEVKKKWGCGL